MVLAQGQAQAMTPLAKAGASPSSNHEARSIAKAQEVSRAAHERLRALCYEKPKEAKARFLEHVEELFMAFDLLTQKDAIHKETYFSFVSAGMQIDCAQGEIKAMLSALVEVSEDWN